MSEKSVSDLDKKACCRIYELAKKGVCRLLFPIVYNNVFYLNSLRFLFVVFLKATERADTVE